MPDPKDNMVLRTVYLPINLDRELRQLAFSRDVSKADLIRDFIRQGLGGVQQTGEKTLADKVQERIDTREKAISSALVSATSKKLFGGLRISISATWPCFSTAISLKGPIASWCGPAAWMASIRPARGALHGHVFSATTRRT